jgi:hypothetical protein
MLLPTQCGSAELVDVYELTDAIALGGRMAG